MECGTANIEAGAVKAQTFLPDPTVCYACREAETQSEANSTFPTKAFFDKSWKAGETELVG